MLNTVIDYKTEVQRVCVGRKKVPDTFFQNGYLFAAGLFSKNMQALSIDRPQRVGITSIWELPFGRGRHFGRSKVIF